MIGQYIQLEKETRYGWLQDRCQEISLPSKTVNFSDIPQGSVMIISIKNRSSWVDVVVCTEEMLKEWKEILKMDNRPTKFYSIPSKDILNVPSYLPLRIQ